MSTPMPSDTQTAFPPLLRGVILGLIIGVAIGYVIPKKPSAQTIQPTAQNQATSQAAPSLATPSTTPPPPPQAPQGFYSKVTKSDKGTITAKEVLSTGQMGTKTYTIKLDQKATLTYQKPVAKPAKGESPFVAQAGKVQDIKKDMYLFVLTTDNPTASTNVTATSIMYSEKNPF